jgi:NADPH2:quinone reductase
MRAVWYERTGPARDVLTVGEMPKPEPGPGEVRVRLMASGVNPADCNRRSGSSAHGEVYPRVVPNSDGAGLVDRVGSGVTGLAEGDPVWLYNGQRNGRWQGTAAQFIALDADLVTRLPAGISFEAGAALGIPCMTAHRCVFAGGPVRGATVLVTGGAGAVGNYAVQLAKWAGARVIATVGSGVQAEDACTAGADVVLDRHRDDVAAAIRSETGGRGVDRIVEVDLGGNLPLLGGLMAQNGAVAYYATRGNSNPSLAVADLMRRNITIQGVFLPVSPIAARRQAQADITRWLTEAPRLHRVAGSFALAATSSAHEAVEAGGKRGTVVVLPQA